MITVIKTKLNHVVLRKKRQGGTHQHAVCVAFGNSFFYVFCVFKKYTKIMCYNKKERYKIKYIRLRPMSWYVRMTGLFPFGRPLIVTWTIP